MKGIITCLFVLALTMCLRHSPVRRKVQNKALFKRALLIVLAADVLAAGLFVLNLSGGKIREVKREGGAQSRMTKRLRVEIEDIVRGQTIDVEVSGRAYTKEEEREWVAQCKKKLAKQMLGSSQRADHVTEDLRLPEKLPDNPTVIRWSQNDYSVLDASGKINQKETQENGTRVVLTAHLTCGSTEDEEQLPVVIFPPGLETKEGYLEEIKRLVRQADEKDPASGSVKLPDQVGEKKIVWKKEGGKEGYLVLIFGVSAAAFLVAQEREKEKKARQIRERKMAEDHPQILNLFSMLLRAGLTPGHIWRLIVEDYEREKDQRGVRPAFEEMAAGLRKMKTGLSQEEVYLDFGNACKDARYEKFGNLLARNLRRGSGGLADELADEARAAFREQKLAAVRRGEQAQTKLLLPMMLLLVIVLMIVMVPAFLSMQM